MFWCRIKYLVCVFVAISDRLFNLESITQDLSLKEELDSAGIMIYFSCQVVFELLPQEMKEFKGNVRHLTFTLFDQ